MSQHGICIAAKVFSDMQRARYELMIAAEQVGLDTPAGRQDIMLSHLLKRGNDAMKADFQQYTLPEIQESSLGPVDGGP